MIFINVLIFVFGFLRKIDIFAPSNYEDKSSNSHFTRSHSIQS